MLRAYKSIELTQSVFSRCHHSVLSFGQAHLLQSCLEQFRYLHYRLFGLVDFFYIRHESALLSKVICYCTLTRLIVYNMTHVFILYAKELRWRIGRGLPSFIRKYLR